MFVFSKKWLFALFSSWLVVSLHAFCRNVECLYFCCMSFLGNLIWIVFGGFLMSLGYLLLGIVYCITIVGIPVGMQLFKMASLALFPFGRDVVDRKGQMGCWSLFLNVLWIVFGGIEMALSHVALGIVFCVTIVGMPFGLQHFKLALLALTPFGKEIR